MRVTLNFKIDDSTLDHAIRSILADNLNVTKKLILNRIKEEVINKGVSVIYFPEYWGHDTDKYESLDDAVIDNLISKYSHLKGK